jgi:hypothetical protein
MRLLVRNRFAVGLPYLYIAIIISFVSLFHSGLRLLQNAVYGRRIRRTVIREAPLFIIGHWRTGTTLLHELLILDERHNYPTTYQCLVPNHFLLTGRWLPKLLSLLMPSRRPMDNMPAGWERPQEDEFGLCMLGLPSPYLTIAFPNRGPAFPEYLDLEGLSLRELRRWKKGFVGFLKELSFRDKRRLVLKSPPHSCRIEVLLELFPDARFVHVVRDPYVVFPSTMNLWKTLYVKHGLQRPRFSGLEDHVFSTFLRLYERLEQGRKLVASSRYHELRYEELVRDPIGEMRALYEALDLPGFDDVLPHLEKYTQRVSGYETNRYAMPAATEAEITRRWGKVIRRLGYSLREGS